jgi:hypothetical protein
MAQLENIRAARRCGAKTRAGDVCRCPAVRDRMRCRLHGGRSTGAPKGRANGNFATGAGEWALSWDPVGQLRTHCVSAKLIEAEQTGPAAALCQRATSPRALARHKRIYGPYAKETGGFHSDLTRMAGYCGAACNGPRPRFHSEQTRSDKATSVGKQAVFVRGYAEWCGSHACRMR